MNKKRMIGIVLVAMICLLLAVTGKVWSTQKQCVIRDCNGEIIAKVSYHTKEGWKYECETGYESYIQLVCEEAAETLVKKYKITEEAAKRQLTKKELQINTYFNKEVYDGIEKTNEMYNEAERNDFAVAVSDVHGNLLACYSHSPWSEETNYLVEKNTPASTLKPLSVYLPALEAGEIFWSSKYMDDAYMQLEEDGILNDWPLNLEPYTKVTQTIKTAVQKSNNTIAVKVLKEHGVEEACHFLSDNFSVDLKQELRLMRTSGEDEILGNIGMGYLREGVTVLQMLGYYQIFANGGEYQPTKTVERIYGSDGEEIIKTEQTAKKVCSEENAYIMNRLLHTVIDANGTGAGAQIKGMDLCGKSGTSSRDRWFIGMSPEYVCAVWYGVRDKRDEQNENRAAEIFGNLICEFPRDKKIEYPVPENVVKKKYCELTGLLANEDCQYVSTGYYSRNYIPKHCNCE